jgi:hypothetical protein
MIKIIKRKLGKLSGLEKNKVLLHLKMINQGTYDK